jgi:hypothetical protein
MASHRFASKSKPCQPATADVRRPEKSDHVAEVPIIGTDETPAPRSGQIAIADLASGPALDALRDLVRLAARSASQRRFEELRRTAANNNEPGPSYV